MRWLLLVALAACSSTSSRAGFDAGPDAKPFFDARIDGLGAPDAYAARPCDAPAMFAEGFTPSRVLHVVPGAVQGDGSVARPFGSIAAAAAVATPGTFIQLAPGTHAPNQFIADLSGSVDAPIWIGGAWGTTPKILGGSEGIHLTRPHFVVIQNLEISSAAANAINIDDGVAANGNAGPVAVSNVYVHDTLINAEASCIKASGVFALGVYDSRIRHCGNGIDAIGISSGVIARNTFDMTVLNAVRVRGGSQGVDVRQNLMNNPGATAITLGGFTPLAQFRPPVTTTTPSAEATFVRAFNNAITGDMNAAFVFDDCVNCLVAHNYVSGNVRRVLRIVQNTVTQNGHVIDPTRNGRRVINNSFSWSLLSLLAHVEVGATVDPTSFTFSHNLWNCSDQPSSSHPDLPVTEDGSVVGLGTGYNPTNLLQYCFGPEAGAAALFPEVDGTLDGFCRVNGDAPTIGPLMQQQAACGI